MPSEYSSAANAYLDLDTAGAVRGMSHLGAPFVATAATAQLIAAEYLHTFADLLQIPQAALARLDRAPDPLPTGDPVEFRFAAEKPLGGLTTVAYDQTVLGLPIWEAGLAVQMRPADQQVLTAQSTAHRDVHVAKPSAAAAKRALQIDPRQLAGALGVGSDRTGGKQALPEIANRRLVVLQFSRAAVQRDPEPPVIGVAESAGVTDAAGDTYLPRLPLPPVPDSFVDGRHYVCVRVDFALPTAGFRQLHWVALLDVETLAALYLRPFVDDVTGLVFDIDPITTNGGPAPTATNTTLNPVRVAKTLEGLVAPVAGVQSLTGDNVTLSDVEAPTVAPPTETSGNNFDFDARTDNFAATNAYEHCDRFFRLADSMGFSRSGYFGGTTFPTPVDHRGLGGNVINAHCVGVSGGSGILQTTFALVDTTDTTNPLGIAADLRVALHELGGHGVLYNHVSSANFKFSHSAGDSIAVILADPETNAPDRFLSFPWAFTELPASSVRRHDRTPAAGWGYGGSIALNPFGSGDGGGYNNEQILSTTMFRIYRSIGGASADLATRQFASRMTIYLILKAISTLTPATNPTSGEIFAGVLQTADADDWTSENITGGAYRKVIRWAFEQQGAFQRAGTATPNNNIGDPPTVDVYIDDGRAGEYQYQPVWWANQSIWNRRNPDNGTTHEEPIVGVTNYAYVTIKNRGFQTATGVTVQAYHADPNAGLAWPSEWEAMTTASLPAANVPANNAGSVTVGPFEWIPRHIGHECMFMLVSATGDESNVDHIKPGDSIPDWRLVPHDNNIGQRNVAPVSGGGTTGLVESFADRTFELRNPMGQTSRMTVEARLPELLSSRRWRLEFVNAGGAAFSLGAGQSRTVTMRIVEGAAFTAADVRAAADRTVHVLGRADGIVVGGMSYELDPDQLHPPCRHGGGHDCTGAAETLLDCLDLGCIDRGGAKVRRVRIRRITVDIDLEEGNC